MSRAAGFAALLLAGCGYTFGSGLPDRGVRTIALDVVGNDTFRQRLEADLSAALARELPVSTDLELADRRTADAVLSVLLTDANERTLVTGERSDPVREGAFAAAVWVRLVGRDGRTVLERRITDRVEFRSPIGEDLTSARGEIVLDLARKIALSLEADF
ncbi:MAG: hypothetical protein JNK15_16940 [Planctomycetes bacterium]|nr:hypothetical protein [Planctomycetota bacterium]